MYVDRSMVEKEETRSYLPAKESRRVDLPDPEGPITAMILPGRAQPLSPFSNLLLFGSTTLRSSHTRYATATPSASSSPLCTVLPFSRSSPATLLLATSISIPCYFKLICQVE